MYRIDLSSDELGAAVLDLAADRNVCILDSCGVGHLGSHLMIAGIEPVDVVELSGNPDDILSGFEKLLKGQQIVIFSISYDLGNALVNSRFKKQQTSAIPEPFIFAAAFDAVVVHDYSTGETFVTGNEKRFETAARVLSGAGKLEIDTFQPSKTSSNFSRAKYIEAIESIKEHIRDGHTYQANLTQQFSAKLGNGLTPEIVFVRLRRDHPAPFAAFLKRVDTTVVSASPERFFKISNGEISASPIKGTRPRGDTKVRDDAFRVELQMSAKDRAENTMIVDLLRSDLGRVCKFGSVEVKRLCELEKHPTLFHLVSTINGTLRNNATFEDILRALFPCGSITGAPKLRTMEIIDQLELSPRGLSMGSIGYYIPEFGFEGLESGFDLSVAIRTMVIRHGSALFNVGGGITIDSDPEAEFEESMVKAKALLAALGNK